MRDILRCADMVPPFRQAGSDRTGRGQTAGQVVSSHLVGTTSPGEGHRRARPRVVLDVQDTRTFSRPRGPRPQKCRRVPGRRRARVRPHHTRT